ncbi:MAG: hypothetical protein RLN70_08810, partial [Rhodospirillaceae bacterium]
GQDQHRHFGTVLDQRMRDRPAAAQMAEPETVVTVNKRPSLALFAPASSDRHIVPRLFCAMFSGTLLRRPGYRWVVDPAIGSAASPAKYRTALARAQTSYGSPPGPDRVARGEGARNGAPLPRTVMAVTDARPRFAHG